LIKNSNAVNNSIESQELYEEIEYLSNLSTYLSLIFRYPDPLTYNAVKNYYKEFAEIVSEYNVFLPDLPLREELEVEYVRLFVANYQGVIAPLYSSVYTSDDGLVLRDSTIELRELMNSVGYGIKEEVKEIEDNLYVMLEFTGVLLSDSLKGDSDVISVVKKINENYINPMLDEFSQRIENSSTIDFYKSVARFLLVFSDELRKLYSI
jgi:TorA maturation chaperone TorD